MNETPTLRSLKDENWKLRSILERMLTQMRYDHATRTFSVSEIEWLAQPYMPNPAEWLKRELAGTMREIPTLRALIERLKREATIARTFGADDDGANYRLMLTPREVDQLEAALPLVEQLLAKWRAEVNEHGIWTSGHSIAAKMAAVLEAALASAEARHDFAYGDPRRCTKHERKDLGGDYEWGCHKEAGHRGACSTHNDCGEIKGTATEGGGVVCGLPPGHAGLHSWDRDDATQTISLSPAEARAPQPPAQARGEPTCRKCQLSEAQMRDKCANCPHDRMKHADGRACHGLVGQGHGVCPCPGFSQLHHDVRTSR